MKLTASIFALVALGLGLSAQASLIYPKEARDVPGYLQLGQRCEASSQCLTHYCGYGYCADKKAGGQGCYKDVGCKSNSCEKGFCSYDDELANGTLCTQSNQCISNNCSKGRCRAQQAGGAHCYKNNNCLSGSCVQGVCAALA